MFKRKSKRKIALSEPIQFQVGYQTFVNKESLENMPSDRGSQESSDWPVEKQKTREKERPLPLPSNIPKNRQKNYGPTYYNKNDYVPTRTKSEPGDKSVSTTKYDYNYPRRRSMTAASKNPGSTRFIRKPSDRQKHQKGESERVSRQWYLKNRTKLKPKRRRYWRRKRINPDTKRQRKYRRLYENRFKRKGYSPFNTPAERTKSWREEQKKKVSAYWPAEWRNLYKKTEPPAGTETKSKRVPRFEERSRQPFPQGDGDSSKSWKHYDQENGSGKVISPFSENANKVQGPYQTDRETLFRNTKSWDEE